MQQVRKARATSGMPSGASGKKPVTGIIQITRSARGFLPFEGKEDIEIKRDDLNGALNGDEVEVELVALFPRPRGKVARVV
jgi:exoribonuclease R